MKEYLWQLIAFSALCGICAYLCPGGESGGYGRQMRLLSGVCMLLLLLSPVRQLAQGSVDIAGALREYFSSLEEQSEPKEDAYMQIDANLAAYATKQGLCEAFALSADDITVGVRLDGAREKIEFVSIGLSGQAIWQDSHAMEEWVQKNIGCQAEVYLK